MKTRKEKIEEFKKTNKANYNYVARVKTLGIVGMVYAIGIGAFDYINRNNKTLVTNYKLSLILDISVFVVSILFIVLSNVVLNKLIKKYNLKKYKDSKKNNK